MTTLSEEGLPLDVSMAVYFVLTVQVKSGNPLLEDRTQRCNFYGWKNGKLVKLDPDPDTKRVVLSPTSGAGFVNYVCLQHLTDIQAIAKLLQSVPLSTDQQLDTDVTLFSAVASFQAQPNTFVPSTFMASVTGGNANPTVMIPVSSPSPGSACGRDLILIFQEGTTESGIIGLRASLDPEIKGTT